MDGIPITKLGGHPAARHPVGDRLLDWLVAKLISIDGTDISSLTIDGTSVSEVTIDDSVAWTAIPDSVVNRWPIQSGSGQTLTDVVGSSDISLNFANWVSSSNWIEGYAQSFDGVDDEGDADFSPPTGSVTILLTVEFPQLPSSDSGLIGWESGFGAGTRYIRLNSFDGDIVFQALVADDSGSLTGIRYLTPLTTGTKYRVGFVLDAQNSSFAVSVNGSPTSEDVSGNYQTTDTQFGLGYNRFDNSNYTEMIADEPMICDQALTSSELEDDYQRQPWS